MFLFLLLFNYSCMLFLPIPPPYPSWTHLPPPPTIAKYWKQPKCPSANDWTKKLWYTYTMEFYAAERKKELIPFATVLLVLRCSHPQYPWRTGSRNTGNTQIFRYLIPLYKIGFEYNLHTSSIYFKSPLDYLQYLKQCKCYVNSCYTLLIE